MPFCPKCKMEYREGFTECSECKVSLVESLNEAEDKENDRIKELEEFENEAETDSISEDVLEEALNEAKSEYRIPKKFVPADEKCADNRSSGYVLLICGVLGLVLMILNLLGVVSLFSGMNDFFFIVMITMFVIFILGGIFSFRNAAVNKKLAVVEKEQTAKFNEYIKEHVKAEEIDNLAGVNDGDDEAGAYLQRFDALKRIGSQVFPDYPEEFIDYIVETYSFEIVFPEGKQ